jgi:hypothetical protein
MNGMEDRLNLLGGRDSHRSRSYSSIDDAEHDATLSYGQCAYSWLASMLQTFKTYTFIDPLMLAYIGLVAATSMERVTFKMMIDRMLPYKFVLLEIIFAIACLLFSTVTIITVCTTNHITAQMRQFPQVQIFNMAVLDTMQFLLLVYSGAGVSPTMTILLLHSSTIFIVLGSKFVFPNRKYGPLHNYGIMLMSIAITLCMLKILWYDYMKNSADFFASRSALIYIGAASLQGLSTLYKEQALTAWSRPINLYYLSAYLFFYQFFVTIAFSGLFYSFTGKHLPT